MHLSYENQRAFGHILLWVSLFNISVPERNILFCNIHIFFPPLEFSSLIKTRIIKYVFSYWSTYFIFKRTKTNKKPNKKTQTKKTLKHKNKPQQKKLTQETKPNQKRKDKNPTKYQLTNPI